ncbi:chymotrypsin inhibitor-like [Calliopsis andreniformis]|uniref:chymotrypsin inhibitor-like n=1 Tax=Calliopsis andreniformis TaxID=337506 RepID=UPI003FCC7DB3
MSCKVIVLFAFMAMVFCTVIEADEYCGPNEVYRSCGSYCQPTCEDPNPICIEVCKPGTCECKFGFVRKDGDCVPLAQCTQP